MKQSGNLLISIIMVILPSAGLLAQQRIKGYVYQDKYRTPLDSVVVYTQSGHTGKSDSTGAYTVITLPKDSIWFQFRDKITHKYPIDTIKNPNNFEVQIFLPKNYVQIPKGYLPTVTVHSRTYKEDSLAFRRDYAKIFAYQTPGQALGESFGIGDQGGIGVDINEIVNLFRFGYNKRKKVYYKFAVDIEQDRYIQYRFTKKLVEEITGLYDEARDEYMKACRPTYDQLVMMNDEQLRKYIKESCNQYFHNKSNDKYEKNIFLSPYDQRHQNDH